MHPLYRVVGCHVFRKYLAFGYPPNQYTAKESYTNAVKLSSTPRLCSTAAGENILKNFVLGTPHYKGVSSQLCLHRGVTM